MPNIAPAEIVLADASASTGGLGKITTVAATTGTLLVCVDNTTTGRTDHIDWRVRTDQACTVQLLRSRTRPTCTLTLTDATSVDDGDTFVLNGLTFTAETTEGDADPAARKWYHPSQAVGAANLAALLTNATYGVPGISVAVTAPSTTDVLTITPTTAPVIQFGQGTSDANEIAFAGPALTDLALDGTATTISASNAAYGGQLIDQVIDGWPYAWLLLTNTTGSALTPTIAATRY